jgi:hypothetical protein
MAVVTFCRGNCSTLSAAAGLETQSGRPCREILILLLAVITSSIRQVTDSEIRHCVDFITSCLEQSEFSFITSECDGRLIFFYAKRPQQQQQEGEEAGGDEKGQDAAGEAQMLFCKVDLRFQRQRSELLNTTSRMVASSVQLQLDPTLTMPPSAISEDKVLPGSELLVFPRESVFNGMVME